jgi:hypothetical protein
MYRNGASTKFSTSEQFRNSNPTVEWRSEHLDGFLWSVGANDIIWQLSELG